MEMFAIVVGMTLLALSAWVGYAFFTKRSQGHDPVLFEFGATLRPQELLTQQELSLYNLLRLAVEDRYLIFLQVPLWSVLRVEAEGPARVQLLRKMALKQLDAVLVHPGSRMVEHVVLWDDGQSDDQKVRRQEIRSLLQAAGVKTIILPIRTSYTVEQLGEALELNTAE